MGNESPSIMFNGRRYWLNGEYYMSRDGRLLHLAVYRAHHGEIPPGFDVHHRDEDKTNNHPDNLEALSRSDHLKRHRPRGFAATPKAVRQERAWKCWGEIEPRDVVCVDCGDVFKSTGRRSKFCSSKCKLRHYRKIGKIVYRKKPREIRPPIACAVCGSSFKSSDPRTLTCSRKCGFDYRSRRREAGSKVPGSRPDR